MELGAFCIQMLPFKRTDVLYQNQGRPRMVDTGMHLRLSHQGSDRPLLLGPALPLVERRGVDGLASCMPGTPGVTARLRVWAT